MSLQASVSDRNSPQKHVWRARIVLLTTDGLGTNEIMRRTGNGSCEPGSRVCCATRRGPRVCPPLPASVRERTMALTLGDPPGEATHWAAAIDQGAAPIRLS
jgi:hypothetical protein